MRICHGDAFEEIPEEAVWVDEGVTIARIDFLQRVVLTQHGCKVIRSQCPKGIRLVPLHGKVDPSDLVAEVTDRHQSPYAAAWSASEELIG